MRIVTFANGLVAREPIVDIDDGRAGWSGAVVGGRASHYNASLQVFAEGEARTPRDLDRRPPAATNSPLRSARWSKHGSAAIKRTLEASERAR